MPSQSSIAVITGASAGVGRATARAFAKRGFDVALVSRGAAGLEMAAKEVEAVGSRALILPTDVAIFEQVDEAAGRVEKELGEIDVWVNDAMTTVFAPLMKVDPHDFQRAVEVTFFGQVWGSMVALSRMLPRDRGNIVNVGSALSFVGIPLQSAYCSSKFACRGFFESTRAELLHAGSRVRMSMVHLPAVNTPQFDWCQTTLDRHPQPVPPIYQPEIAARAIVEAALDGRRAKILGAWNKMLVLLDSLFPALGNHYAALGAWDAQMTGDLVKHDRPSNLRRPVDDDEDHGAHGMFDARAGGVLDATFLRSLPSTVSTFLEAAWRAVQDARETRTRRAQATNAADRLESVRNW